MEEHISIKQWAEDDRPREKMRLKGRKSMSDAELLAIILGSGYRNTSALELAKQLLDKSSNNLMEFSKKTLADLCKFKGVGEAKAISIIAALELGRRRKEVEPLERSRIRSSKQAYEILRPYFEDLTLEEFYVIYLNRANEVLGIEQLSMGGMAGTVVDGKVLFKKAFDYMASGLILAHNHPSGTLSPSQQDKDLTKKLSQFGKMIDLPILDHLIYTDFGYFSFADENILE